MTKLRVAVIGAGPAGFYTARALLRRFPDAKIDILERLPVPFGLVRYGVAPDHPATRYVSAQFSALIQDNPRLSFYGNVLVRFDYETNLIGNGTAREKEEQGEHDGEELSICIPRSELDEFYHITLRATGAAHPRLLDTEGVADPCVDQHVHTAHNFVLWINGHPDLHADGRYAAAGRALGTTLRTARDVAVIGAGNVALDVARLLLRPRCDLLRTEASPSALRALLASPTHDDDDLACAGLVRNVNILARRAPQHAAWSTAALREVVTKLPGVITRCDQAALAAAVSFMAFSSRSDMSQYRKRRALDILARHAVDPSHYTESGAFSSLTLLFNRQVHALRSVLPSDNPNGKGDMELLLRRTDDMPSAAGTDVGKATKSKLETLRTNVVFLSLGYVSPHPNLYRAGVNVGWANRARGIIGDNKVDAETVVSALEPPLKPLKYKRGILAWLRNQPQQVVTWKGWERIREAERLQGLALGRPAGCHVRIESLREMLHIAQGAPINTSLDKVDAA